MFGFPVGQTGIGTVYLFRYFGAQAGWIPRGRCAILVDFSIVFDISLAHIGVIFETLSAGFIFYSDEALPTMSFITEFIS